MSFAQRFALVVLAAFFMTSIVTSLAAYLAAPAVRRAVSAAPASTRARALACFRLLPAAAALSITTLVLAPGYFRHEQRGELESVGLLIACAAAGAALLVSGAAVAVARAIARTSSLRCAWLAGARPLPGRPGGMPAFEIDAPFPLVAVIGAFRPRLFISSAVRRTCTDSELDAIVEHERSHVTARDNAMRLLLDGSPDLFGWTARARDIDAAWQDAVEHRADDAAANRLELASALVRVARLATAARSVALPASALYRGEGIEQRVRRLLGARETRDGRFRRLLAGACGVLAVTLAAAASSPRVSEIAHRVLERAVSMF